MSDRPSFGLPLRPLIDKPDSPSPDSLPLDIARITAQYGAFRDVSEASLRAALHAEQQQQPQDESDSDTDMKQDQDQAQNDLDPADRMEQLYKRRHEITQFALQAHMEAMFALDFTSLCLSKYTPRQAETSLSPYVKQFVPLGSLSTEVVHPPPKPEEALQDTRAVSRGWRLQNFNAAASKLLQSATRLESEVAAETRYWNEVLAVKDKGWKLCRLPREQQSLGVQYGFLEATPIFRNRGLASLRRAEDGSVSLDKGLMPQTARRVRVRVMDHGRLTGCSALTQPLSTDSIESRILQARDTVFEEELFHELAREARILGSQGVVTRQHLVKFPVSDEQEVLLDLVDLDEESTLDSHDDDQLATAIAHAIRILLTHAHRQNLHRRTQPPPPLTPKRRHTPEYHLLRPVMAYLHHRANVRWLETLLRDLHRVLQAAGLGGEFTATPFASVHLGRQDASRPIVEALVRSFVGPLTSTFSGKLASPQGSFRAAVRTSMATPPWGTQFEIAVHLPQYPDLQPPTRLTMRDEAASVLTHLTLLDIVSAIAHGSSVPCPTPSADAPPTRPVQWEPTYPHHGQLMAQPSEGHQRQHMHVKFTPQALTVEVTRPSRPGQPDPPAPKRFEWTADSSGAPRLMDFVAEVSTSEH